MIATHVSWFHWEGKRMIEHERKRDLSLLYPLLRPLPSGLTALVQKFTEHITQQGLQAISSLQEENVRNMTILNVILFSMKLFYYLITT